MPGPSTAHRKVDRGSLEKNRTTMRLVRSNGATDEIPVCGSLQGRTEHPCKFPVHQAG